MKNFQIDGGFKMTNEEFERIQEIPVKKETTIRILIELLEGCNKLNCILDRYSITRRELNDKFIAEMLIPGMTFGVAWHAMNFLSIEIEKGISADSLMQAIRDNIIAAGVYMTNVPKEKRRELEGR